MNRIIAITAAMLFAASVSAEHVYKGLAEDHPSLKEHTPVDETPAPGTVTEADVYKGLSEKNPDLPSDIETTKPPTEENPEIYKEIQPNPDLKY